MMGTNDKWGGERSGPERQADAAWHFDFSKLRRGESGAEKRKSALGPSAAGVQAGTEKMPRCRASASVAFFYKSTMVIF